MLTLVRKAVSFELGMWRSLYRWILRRPPATGTVFGYAGAVTPIFGVFNTLPMGRTVRVEDGALHVAVSNQTSVDVVLREPTVFAPSKGEHVREVRIHADDPDALVRRVRQMVILP